MSLPCPGLSTVHTSRTVSILRDMGLLVWKRGQLTMLDPARLFILAGLPMELQVNAAPLSDRQTGRRRAIALPDRVGNRHILR